MVNNNDFREYVYSKGLFNKIYGFFFRNSLYYNFSKAVIQMRKVIAFDHTQYADYSDINNNKPNYFVYGIWKNIIYNMYNIHVANKIKINRKKIVKFLKTKNEVNKCSK